MSHHSQDDDSHTCQETIHKKVKIGGFQTPAHGFHITGPAISLGGIFIKIHIPTEQL